MLTTQATLRQIGSFLKTDLIFPEEADSQIIDDQILKRGVTVI